MINLYYWNKVSNFGDQISPDVVKFVSNDEVVSAHEKLSGKLISTGSVLGAAIENDDIWGSGVHPTMFERNIWQKIGLKGKIDLSSINFHCVRGPVTRDFVLTNGGMCDEIYGDPAVLAPLIYPKEHQPKYKIGLIQHFGDDLFSHDDGILRIDVKQPWRSVVDAMMLCEKIISSSLHGIVVCEAYGIPGILLRAKSEGVVKYIDYYEGTGRVAQISYTLDDALQIASKKTPSPPDFRYIQHILLSSFPVHLRKKQII